MDQAQVFLISLLAIAIALVAKVSAQPGFLSLDCGGNGSYTDPATGIQWQQDNSFLSTEENASLVDEVSNSSLRNPYRRLRSFPGANRKSCYSLPVNASQRYLVRASFLYGNYDGRNTAPEFLIYLNTTRWADVRVEDANREIFEEMVFLSTGPTVEVCLVTGNAGVPFISTLELRQLIGSMYSVPYEGRAHLQHIVRINFGALTTDDIRYPDDVVDRRWQSDLTRPNNLAMEAPGTIRVSTTSRIGLDPAAERPPERVMQSAVVGSNGTLTYRYLIQEFPAFTFSRTYFAEIQNLNASDVRAFTFELQNDTFFRDQVLNLQSDIGAFQAYEPGFDNISLPRIINFAFQSSRGSNLGPILNAMEIMRIVNRQAPTSLDDVNALDQFMRQFGLSGTGDPCIPLVWSWISCVNDNGVPRVSGILLPRSNLSGMIPSGIAQMTSLNIIDFGNNSLSGSIPDLRRLTALRELHLENNRLSGDFPGYLQDFQTLQELYVQNNLLTGSIPEGMVNRPGLDFQFSGNPNLCTRDCSDGSSRRRLIGAIVGGLLGGIILCSAAAAAFYFLYLRKKRRFKSSSHKNPTANQPADSFTSMISTHQSHGSESGSFVQDQPGGDACRYSFQEMKEASNNFSNKVGSGGFGTVYYGRFKNGNEVAIKVLSPNSHQGSREFSNEVTLLSRIHHRNLVSFLGYCQEGRERILVYEFMHVGTLRECLSALSAAKQKSESQFLSWAARIKVLLDAARGLDYLHTGCFPSIIHRDIKSSNILISDKRIGKVSDFGLSKMTSEESTLVSTTVKGTVGYLDPEYYMNQRLTEKSDVYSFGIVLLETISAREPLNPDQFEPESNIVQWARVALQRGDIKSIVDPALGDSLRMESLWKVGEIAMYCVEPHGINRPTMAEVVRELQEALDLEEGRLGGESSPRPNPHEHFPNGDSDGKEEEQEESSRMAAAATPYHLDAPRNPLPTMDLSSVFAQPHAR